MGPQAQPQCCLPWCCQKKSSNNKKLWDSSKTSDIYLYTFPISRNRQLQWIKNIKLDFLQTLPRAALAKVMICSNHFREEFKTVEWPKKNPALTLDAVPTINIDPPPFMVFENRINFDHNEDLVAKSNELIFNNDSSEAYNVATVNPEPVAVDGPDTTSDLQIPGVEVVPVVASKLVSYPIYAEIIARMEQGMKELQSNIAEKFQLTPESVDVIWKSRMKMKNETFDQIVLVQTEGSEENSSTTAILRVNVSDDLEDCGNNCDIVSN